MRWSDKEKKELMRLLEKTGSITETSKIFAAKHGKKEGTVRSFIKYHRKRGNITVKLNRKYKYWTKNEIKTLLNLIQKYPHNFSEACRIHAKNTDRNWRAVQNFFERYREKEDAKVCMMTLGALKTVSPNRKNIHSRTKGEVTPIKISKWKRILAILFE